MRSKNEFIARNVLIEDKFIVYPCNVGKRAALSIQISTMFDLGENPIFMMNVFLSFSMLLNIARNCFVNENIYRLSASNSYTIFMLHDVEWRSTYPSTESPMKIFGVATVGLCAMFVKAGPTTSCNH